MNSVDSPPKKSRTYNCRDCGLASLAPIVKPVGNPKHDADGRCSNRAACDRRVRRNKARATAKEKAQ